MRTRTIYLIFSAALISIAALVQSCDRDPELLPETTAEDIKFYVPAGFPQPYYNFNNNPITLAGFELGRKLFYDPILSRDNTVSCGSCHQQFVAFAHSEHALSHGINGQFGTRNAPGLFNLAWHNTFMWDGGVNHIESQPLAPITNPLEMDESIANVIAKLSASATYRALFEKAFGDDSITTQRMTYAITQFQGLMISANSKYDKYMRGEAQLSQQETNGLATFRTKCASCHPEPLFTDNAYHNIGLEPDPTIMDAGRMRITGNAADSMKFKTPSLRNITLTGPYMHDGRFQTLQECLDQITNPLYQSATLDPVMAAGISLTPQEKADLIAFLATLTDFEFIHDPKFAEQ